MKSFVALTRCKQFNFNRVLSVSVSPTSSYCDRCFSTFSKITAPCRVTGYGSAGRKLRKPFCGVFERECWHEQCMSSYLSSLAWTVHSSCCAYPAANWIINSRLLKSCHHSIDVALQPTLNSRSATAALKRVHNSRTVGLSRSNNSKNYQKWSLSEVVQQLVCHRSCFIIPVFYQLLISQKSLEEWCLVIH